MHEGLVSVLGGGRSEIFRNSLYVLDNASFWQISVIFPLDGSQTDSSRLCTVSGLASTSEVLLVLVVIVCLLVGCIALSK